MELIWQGKQRLADPEWETIKPIHEDALQKAAEALDEIDHTKFDAEQPLKIKRWLLTGQFDEDDEGPPMDTNGVYSLAGDLLDGSESHEIFGSVLFEGENGKYYTISVEGSLAEANPDYVKDVLGDEAAGSDEEDDADTESSEEG